MKRDENVVKAKEYPDEWDVIIIGGGATGLGAAVDSASRGFKTILLEQHDFAKATSSRSTKLIHGGLRYLQQGNISLVVEALKERGLLCQNAPHLVHHLPFLVPNYRWWEGPFYGIGIKIYDMLAGKLGLEPSRSLSKKETLKSIPTLESKGLRGGIIYYDGQFDDSRLAITLMRTFEELGGVAINYARVSQLIKEKHHCTGVKFIDEETKKSFHIKGKVIINATGIFTDTIRKMDDKKAQNIIAPSQGIHLVLPKKFQPSETAILVPQTEDGRVLFLVPWHDRVLLGTTDTAVKKSALEPKPLKSEINFLLKYASQYLTKAPTHKDILSVFAGHRPLIKSKSAQASSSISRDHTIIISKSGLITIAGGKWTTYRKMAEDVINKAILIGNLPDHPCITKTLHLHGWKEDICPKDFLSPYGSEARLIKALEKENETLKEFIHPKLPYKKSQVVWAVRKEMARTVEDVLSRRLRALLLDAKSSIEAAEEVAKIMAHELNQSPSWQKSQITQYEKMAKTYLPYKL
jgi:glycerol-3-phosphate dehydrogenase